MRPQQVASLYNYTSLQTQAAAMCLAQVAVGSQQKQQHLADFISKIQDSGNAQSQVKGALCLGEFGKMEDLSGV